MKKLQEMGTNLFMKKWKLQTRNGNQSQNEHQEPEMEGYKKQAVKMGMFFEQSATALENGLTDQTPNWLGSETSNTE